MYDIFEIAAICGVILAFIGLILNLINFLYTWYKNRVVGPKFLLPDVWIENPWIPTEDNETANCRIMSIYQNIGDRFGYISTVSAKLKVNTGIEEIETDKLNSKLLELRFHPGQHVKRVFSFILPKEAENWISSEMSVEVKIIDHKGRRRLKAWRFNLKR